MEFSFPWIKRRSFRNWLFFKKRNVLRPATAELVPCVLIVLNIDKSFRLDLIFKKSINNHFFSEKLLASKYRQFKKTHAKDGYSRLRSVHLNCVNFWNQCQVDIFYHQTQKILVLNFELSFKQTMIFENHKKIIILPFGSVDLNYVHFLNHG